MYIVINTKSGTKAMINLDYISEIRVTKDEPANIVAYDAAINKNIYLGTYENENAAEKAFYDLLYAINKGTIIVYDMSKVPEKKMIVS
jgi:hypothetical protein